MSEEARDDAEEQERPHFEVEPSELDETTHAESLVLYTECQNNIRFSKSLQWRMVAGTLALFALFVAAADMGHGSERFVKTIIDISPFVSAGAICTLVILQAWQNTERSKIRAAAKFLSNYFRAVYRKKSRQRANLHRYVLLSFMILTICVGNFIVVKLLLVRDLP